MYFSYEPGTLFQVPGSAVLPLYETLEADPLGVLLNVWEKFDVFLQNMQNNDIID